MNYQYEIFEDKVGEYRWRYKAPNGEIVATSEGYTRKESCAESIKLMKASGDAKVVDETI